MRADRATMRHGVEGPEILALAFRIPPSLRAATPKGLLRACARERLPAPVVERPKSGFPAAPGVLLAPAALARIRERVLARPFLELTGFAPASVAGLLAAGQGGRAAVPVTGVDPLHARAVGPPLAVTGSRHHVTSSAPGTTTRL